MTFSIAFLFALLIGMVYLFLTEKLPVDLTAFLGLIVLIFGGYLTPSEAFTGFSSPAVITMLSVFIVGAALLETGVADLIGSRIHMVVGDSETRLIVTLMVVAGVLSAFMNNIAATAVLMPAVATIGPRAGLAPGRLFMPLAFGAILGGTTTLVGTPPNILAAQVLEERGLEPFRLFDFTPIGVAIMVLGTVYMLTIGRRLLPARAHHGPTPADASSATTNDLNLVYQLKERLFSIALPEATPLDGKTLGETRIGQMLRVKIAAVVRNGRRHLAPRGSTTLRAGDVLFVTGEEADLRELVKLQGVELGELRAAELSVTGVDEVRGLRAQVPVGSNLCGQSLAESRFRDRFGVVVVAVEREGERFSERLAELTFEAGDLILGLGRRDRLEDLHSGDQLEIENLAGLEAIGDRNDLVSWIRVPKKSSLVGGTIRKSRLGELLGLTVVGLIRQGETMLPVPRDEVIAAEDRLLVSSDPAELERLLDFGEIELDPAHVDSEAVSARLESEEVGMVEVAIPPRSGVAGRTLTELDFHQRYGLLALALWRDGRAIHSDLGGLALRSGDALFLQGPRKMIQKLAADADFVVLSQAHRAPRRTRQAPLALAGLVLMIALVATGWQPIHVAAFTAASLVILAGALSMKEAYQAIEWRAIFLVAAVLPVGMAMERTGAALLLAEQVAALAGPLGPHAILAALVMLASLLSQGLDGAPAVVLLAPVVLQTAEGLGISPYPLMMGVSLAASAAFMTPFSHKANLLVMGAGGYRSSDYLKVGSPLTVMIFVLLVLLVPVFFPFGP